MPLWKIALISYAVLRVGHSVRALAQVARMVGVAEALRFLTGWRIYADTVFIAGVMLMASDTAVFTQPVWIFVFVLAVGTALYDLIVYPQQIKSEPNIDEQYLRRSRLRSLANWPIYAGLFVYAFVSPHIWQ